MKAILLFLLIITLSSFISNAQSELIGDYKETTENNQLLSSFKISKIENNILRGLGTFTDGTEFEFNCLTLEMDYDISFGEIYRTLIQLKKGEYKTPSHDYFELEFSIEYEVVEDEEGFPEETSIITGITVSGFYHTIDDKTEISMTLVF